MDTSSRLRQEKRTELADKVETYLRLTTKDVQDNDPLEPKPQENVIK